MYKTAIIIMVLWGVIVFAAPAETLKRIPPGSYEKQIKNRTKENYEQWLREYEEKKKEFLRQINKSHREYMDSLDKRIYGE